MCNGYCPLAPRHGIPHSGCQRVVQAILESSQFTEAVEEVAERTYHEIYNNTWSLEAEARSKEIERNDAIEHQLAIELDPSTADTMKPLTLPRGRPLTGRGVYFDMKDASKYTDSEKHTILQRAATPSHVDCLRCFYPASFDRRAYKGPQAAPLDTEEGWKTNDICPFCARCRQY